MSRTVNCPECGRQLRLADQLEGSEVRCPVCNQAISVPAAPPESLEAAEVVPVEGESPPAGAWARDIARPVREPSQPRRDARPPGRAAGPRREQRSLREEDAADNDLDARL